MRPCLGRGAGALALAALGFVASPAGAQDFGYIDANGLPAAGPAQAFFVVPGPSSLEAGRFGAAFRSSVLARPISATQPSPSAEGTDTAVVSWLWLQELQLAVGLGHGIDVSLALPVHLLQSGQALTGVGIGDALAPIALGDLRLGVGAAFRAGAWTIGPRGVVYLPTGQEEDFAGERLPRGDLGLAASLDAGSWHFGGSVFARIRETSEIGNTRWAPQAALALAARYAWSPQWDASLELLALPTLTEQPTPPSGSAGYLLPAEVLLGTRYRSEALVLGGFIGTGLPMSSASVTGSPTRGPTSPLLRIGIEIGTSF
jgi:hypothetical protein